MKAEQSLRRRVIAACVLLAAVVGGVFSAATYVLIESVEHELIDRRLTRTAATVMAGWRDGTTVLPPNDLRFVHGDALPPALRKLAAGLHELDVEDRQLHVLVIDERGERFAVIDDQSDFERLERIAYLVLAVAFGAGLLLAVGIGKIVASGVIAPVTALARAVDADTLAGEPGLLGSADEIGVLARAFDARARALQQAIEREQLFTADVSHELRTPLAVMLGAAEMLEARLADRPELRAAAARLRRNAGDAAQRVGALLQLARAPEQLPRERFDLRQTAQREFERNRPLLQGKAVLYEFVAPEAVWVEAAPDLAAVAIDNLLRNACQFTQQGRIDLHLDADRLVVEDTGPGVPEALRERLFERFAQGDAAAPHAGSGLGLSITRRMADHLGWDLRHDALPGGGSRFTLCFAAQDMTVS